MTEKLNQKIIEAHPDDLIIGNYPPKNIGSGTIKSGAGELKRGTLLSKDADGKLDIIGKSAASGGTQQDSEQQSSTTTATAAPKPYGILCDDITVGDEDTVVAVYTGGKFNSNKIIVAAGYTITEDDKDTLRAYGIELAAALKF